MDLQTLSSQLEERTGLPVAYREFPKEAAPPPPFAVYYTTGREDDLADDGIYYRWTNVTVELYTDKKKESTEKKVEDFLESLDITYTKNEDWIDEQKMYMNVYDFMIGE